MPPLLSAMLLPSRRKLRALAWQGLALAIALGVLLWLVSNALTNLEARRIGTGFGFLERPAGIPIGETLIDYAPFDANARAILVGLLNTLLVAASGIVLATIIGVAVGFARLSRNWLLARVASAFVEFVRNVPLLAHLLLIYTLLQMLPPPRSALSLAGVVSLSNRGLVLPTLHMEATWPVAIGAGVAAALLACALAWYRRARRERSSKRRRLFLYLQAVLFVSAVVLIWRGTSFTFVVPRLTGFNFAGGTTISPELTALLAGLSLYFGAFIVEIVRGGILAVAPGQWDAGHALGLNRARVLRLVVLPQALRLIVPPMTNQYLDLVKSSSLAIAIGYPDLVAVINSIITNTGQAIECVAMIMGAFLVFSLSISLLMNWYNARIALADGRS